MTSNENHMSLESILDRLSPEEREFVSGLIDKDPLTGVYNRRKFDGNLELVIAMSDRSGKGSSLLMIDIDYFKKYNDEYGHQKGDQVLREVTMCIENNLRNYDKTHIYRYGGEEFVVIVYDITTGHAVTIGERLGENVKVTCGVSVSIGISHYTESSNTLQSLINNADSAMYEAKRKGRDRVEVFKEA